MDREELVFRISGSTLLEINEWKEAIKKVYGKYGEYEYTFIPTGIGTAVSVKSNLAGISRNFTDTSNW